MNVASTVADPTGFLTLADLELALNHDPEFTSVQASIGDVNSALEMLHIDYYSTLELDWNPPEGIDVDIGSEFDFVLSEFVKTQEWRYLSYASMSRRLTNMVTLPSFKASLKIAGKTTASIRGDFDISIKLCSGIRTVNAAADYVSGYSPYEDPTKFEPCSVIIQAKKTFGVSRELPQTLACMVGVPQHLINSGFEAATIYGTITDGVN